MESIQLAQMLADLSDLDAAQEASASVALVNANKSALSPSAATVAGHEHSAIIKSSTDPRHHQHSGSAAGAVGRTASPASRFDMFGRRILTPPMTRSSSNQGSIPGTPRHDEHEDDVDRASTLMSLYEIRAKIKQQDNQSLMKAREKIAALAAKQQAQAVAEKNQAQQAQQSHNRYVYPKQT